MNITVVSPAWLVAITITPIIFWLSPAGIRDFVLAFITACFLYYVAPLSLALLSVLATVTYFATSGNSSPGRHAVVAGLIVTSTLVAFKYLSNDASAVAVAVAMPLGLSFYAIRCLHYLVEKYNRRLPEHGFSAFVTYLFFVPTILAGPIHRFAEFDRDRRGRRWDAMLFSAGLERILYGFAKIIIVGNYVISNKFAAFISAMDPNYVALIAYLDLLRHGFNLYIQFSGYSDVAIGFSMLLGYRIIENFDWPFLKRNISEFWRSWHISLTSWVREHVFLLGVLLTRSRLAAIIVSMVVLGLWHELSYRYIVWGLYHGIGIACWQQFQKIKPPWPLWQNKFVSHVTHVASVLVTFHFVMFGFAIVKEPDLAATAQTLKSLLFFWQ